MTPVRLRPHPSTLRCPLCRDRLELDQPGLRACLGCGVVVHGECADEVRGAGEGRCPNPGCALALVQRPAPPAPPPGPAPREGWRLHLARLGLALTLGIPLGFPPLGIAVEVLGGVEIPQYVLHGLAWLFLLGFPLLWIADSGRRQRPTAPRPRPAPPKPSSTSGPRPHPAPANAAGPSRRRCLLCPQPAQTGDYCAAHAGLVGERISSSPPARGIRPGPRYGPGRLNVGSR